MEYKLLLKQKLDNMRDYNIIYNKMVIGVLCISVFENNIFIRQIRIYEKYKRSGHAKNLISFLMNKYKKNIKFCIASYSESAAGFWQNILQNNNHIHIRGDIYELIYQDASN